MSEKKGKEGWSLGYLREEAIRGLEQAIWALNRLPLAERKQFVKGLYEILKSVELQEG